jgi:hypothetical protein
MIDRRTTALFIVMYLLGACAQGARADLPAPTFGGMGTPPPEPAGPCLTDAQRADIRARLEETRALLRARGELWSSLP